MPYYRSLIEQTVIEVLGSELCQISVKVAQFFEQQKKQVSANISYKY